MVKKKLNLKFKVVICLVIRLQVMVVKLNLIFKVELFGKLFIIWYFQNVLSVDLE